MNKDKVAFSQKYILICYANMQNTLVIFKVILELMFILSWIWHTFLFKLLKQRLH